MDPRAVLLILLLFFVIFGPKEEPFNARLIRDPAAIEARNQQLLGVLRNSSYGDLDAKADRWLNLTGFRRDDGYQWELLPIAQKVARTQLRDATGGHGGDLPVYRRPEGKLQGRFSRLRDEHKGHQINLTALVPGTNFITSNFARNVTEGDGGVELNLSEKKWNTTRSIQEIAVQGSITSESSPGSGWDLSLFGTHCVRTGAIILTTASDKYNAAFAFPHFALNADDFTSIREVADEVMSEALTKLKDGNTPFQMAELFPSPSCEIIVWLQQKPLQFEGLNTNDTRLFINEIENELENPDGAPIGEPPEIRYSGVVFSPDCGFILDLELQGPKREVFRSLASRSVVGMIIVIILQMVLSKRQVEEASTPSTRSRIAYQTIGIMTMGDGLLFIITFGFLSLGDDVFFLVAAAAFVNFLNMAFLDLKFVFDVWMVQVGDPAQREIDRYVAAASVEADPVGLPLPVTAQRPVDTGATPIIILPPDQDIDAAAAEDAIAMGTRTAVRPTPVPFLFAGLYFGTCFFLFIIFIISVSATSWPKALRSAYANLISFLYLSFWVPQIYRNIIRNCRKALNWEYVIGTSILRTGLIVYWNLDERNILSINIRPTSAYVLVGWVWLQVFVLASQQFLGPRLFVRDAWCPPAYEYHPILREDDVETGSMLPIGFVASASEAKEKDEKDGGNRKIFDCAICMNEIDVPVVSKRDGTGIGAMWLEQRNYMVTPCRHIFHTECLVGWMNLRLVCPICREALPAL